MNPVKLRVPMISGSACVQKVSAKRSGHPCLAKSQDTHVLGSKVMDVLNFVS
jgi:hypothetical protein